MDPEQLGRTLDLLVGQINNISQQLRESQADFAEFRRTTTDRSLLVSVENCLKLAESSANSLVMFVRAVHRASWLRSSSGAALRLLFGCFRPSQCESKLALIPAGVEPRINEVGVQLLKTCTQEQCKNKTAMEQ
ncbi:hypothetical protein M5K25_026959 [Dendrobium thyrsiflorum]|uniref:Uncharacterized protein n=1 Tax=Dendrobium thyrsiflorum TaxID=117978 RepID=A0ABD0TYK0_DENTH